MVTGLREMTVRTDIARGIKAITEKRIHLEEKALSSIGMCCPLLEIGPLSFEDQRDSTIIITM